MRGKIEDNKTSLRRDYELANAKQWLCRMKKSVYAHFYVALMHWADSARYTLATLIMSAKTPAAVTSAPAP